jgi:hypothetical protein
MVKTSETCLECRYKIRLYLEENVESNNVVNFISTGSGWGYWGNIISLRISADTDPKHWIFYIKSMRSRWG